jgi:hypothetical protein
MNSHLQYQVSELRMQNVQTLLETISVFIAALISASLLPSLLMEYVYKDQAALMTQAPFWVQNGPLVIFGLSMLFFVYSMVQIFLKSRKIAGFKKQLAMTYNAPSFSNDEMAAQQAELEKLEKMVDEALKESQPTKKVSAKKKSAAK